jgi:hypothetical protein
MSTENIKSETDYSPKPPTVDVGSLAHGSGACQTCNLWEPEKGYRADMANMGYCPLFNKRVRFDHGTQCTGHSDLH